MGITLVSNSETTKLAVSSMTQKSKKKTPKKKKSAKSQSLKMKSLLLWNGFSAQYLIFCNSTNQYAMGIIAVLAAKNITTASTPNQLY